MRCFAGNDVIAFSNLCCNSSPSKYSSDCIFSTPDSSLGETTSDTSWLCLVIKESVWLTAIRKSHVKSEIHRGSSECLGTPS